ncbi:hypothetical protein M409DRAFT_28639 [Zasmidium cellare ATCC 36951]|uniref:Uncharacterized protein n=1 Tax=Zasmidium cellare ATCC 36951 TaxID=1080233 RepID=A0A6A6C294_ZASCE|nr:uncharacterized protein M409DRAFT_28639 [Zasmidium cellare ATCC 36951]KAF2161033.1 hypothetical protein M409DRAFT_28639 [Zasmidium cellare ATCC 36951]
MASGRLLSHSPWLTNAAALIALPMLALGAVGTMSPLTALKMWDSKGVPNMTTSEVQLGKNLILYLASRDVLLGLSILAAWNNRERKTLGHLMLLGCVVVVYDFVIQERQTSGEGRFKHLPLLPICFGVGGGILGWFDRL